LRQHGPFPGWLQVTVLLLFICNGFQCPDAADRLRAEAVTGSAPNVTTSYAYDLANNRTSKVVTGGSTPGTTTYVYNNLNQLTSWTSGSNTTSYVYNRDGDRFTRAVNGLVDTYSYDFKNRLTQVTKNTPGAIRTFLRKVPPPPNGCPQQPRRPLDHSPKAAC
jgi:YD repeat-containing protein